MLTTTKGFGMSEIVVKLQAYVRWDLITIILLKHVLLDIVL